MTFTTLLFSGVLDDAVAAFEKGEYPQVLEILQVEIDSGSTNSDIFLLSSQAAEKLDDLDQANSYIVKAIEYDKKNETYREHQKKLEALKNGLKDAKKTYDSGYMEEAENEYSILADKYPQNAIVFYTIGLVKKQSRNYAEAIQNYRKALALNPFEDKYKKAIIVIAQLVAKNGDTEFRRKEYDSALLLYSQAVEFYPEFVDGLFRVSKTYYSMKDFENTQLWCEKTINVDPSHVQAIKMLGDIYRRNGNNEKSIDLYRQAVNINPNYDRAYYSLGVALKDAQDFTGAIDALNKALLLNPAYTKAYETLGVVHQAKGDIENAIYNYKTALKTDSKAYKNYYRLAEVYNTQKNYESARDAAKSCLRIKGNYAAAFCELGIAEMNMCNKVAAEDAFNKAKKDRNYRKFASDYIKNLNYYTKDCN
jgi:tetratricopeptide (TPR) repeat protein